MRRLLTLALLALVPTFALAKELRFPKAGKHGFALDLPQGWHSKTDEKSGMLLIPPAPTQHVMVYIGFIVDDALRGKPLDAVADKAGAEAGVKSFDKQEEARVTASNGGALHRGTAFYGNIAEKRRHSRRAKIVIIPRAEHLGAGLDRDAAGHECGRVQGARPRARKPDAGMSVRVQPRRPITQPTANSTTPSAAASTPCL